MSSRSSVIVAGSTMSAWRAIGGPGGLVHDDRVRPGEGAPQAVQILVVMERVAAGPVDEPDVGIGQRLRRCSRTARRD